MEMEFFRYGLYLNDIQRRCFPNINRISNLPCFNKNDVSFQNEFHRMMKNVIVDQYFSVLRQDQVVYHQKEKEKEKKNAKKILI